MKIAMFIPVFFPYHSRSGISNVAYFISKYMVEKGHEVYVYSCGAPENKEFERVDNIAVHRFHAYLKDQPFSFGMLKSLMERFDVIHSFHYGFPTAMLGLFAAKMTHTPHIFTPAYHPPIYGLSKKMFSSAYNFTQGFPLLKYSDTVLPFNNDEKNRLRHYVKGNYNVVPCPINSDVFYPQRTENDKITLGYVGPMLPWKGAKIAFDIFREIERERKHVQFLFVGLGQLENEIKKAAGKRFAFKKNLTPEQLAQCYNSIDMLVSPTYYESFSCILAEAGMCGTPVVSTRVGGVPETVDDGGILVDYGDWKVMKEAILRAIDDGNLRRKLSKNAINHTKKFRYDVVGDAVEKIYEESSKA